MKPEILPIKSASLLEMAQRDICARIRTNPRTGHKFLIFDPIPEQPFIMRRRHFLRLFGVPEVCNWTLFASAREAIIWLTDDREEEPLVKSF